MTSEPTAEPKAPNTFEVVYTWPDTRTQEVRYRRPAKSEDARELQAEVEALQKKDTDCCYSFREVYLREYEPTAETKREAIVGDDALQAVLQQCRESMAEHRCGFGTCHVCRAMAAIDGLGKQPRYTIDQIVDGLRLEWFNSNPATSGIVAESFDGWYMATADKAYFRRSQECAWTVIRESLGRESNQTACLADYRQRFRAELERAVGK